MQVEISEEVQKIIIELCDLALRSGGLKNKPYVDKGWNYLKMKTLIEIIVILVLCLNCVAWAG